MSTLILQRDTALVRRLWHDFMAATSRPMRRRRSPMERFLDQAVDFADLEHRMRMVDELDRHRMW